MRWVHISDIHQGREGPNSQRTALDSLVDALKVAVTGSHLDAIIISGDLSNAGKPTQFSALATHLLSQLRAIPACSTAAFFAVPGNHDLDCDVALPTRWESLGQKRQNVFFDESLEGASMRKPRTDGFEAYTKFLNENNILGVEPTSAISSSHVLSTYAGKKTLVVTTNTALFCDKDFEDREFVPPPDPSLRTVLRAAATADHILVVGHHPIDWFLPQTRNAFRQLLLTHKAIYLHGHLHQLGVNFGAAGVESIGFGAAYIPPTGDPNPGFYNNCFALCDLGESDLEIAPYHWDNDNGRWVPTTTLPPGFSKSGSRIRNSWALRVAREPDSPILSFPLPKPTPKIVRFLPATHLTAADWRYFLVYTRLLPPDVTADKLTQVDSPQGEINFEYTLPAGRHYVRCLPGSGNHLSRAQIEDINTRLDTEGYQSVTLVTTGTLSDDAETVYLRLHTRKAIWIFTARELGERLSSSGPLSGVVNDLDSALTDCEFAVGPRGIPFLIVRERLQRSWFYVIAPDGVTLAETDPRVIDLRRTTQSLNSISYRGAAGEAASTAPAFDREAYLKACHSEFGAFKYAPLAAIGLRLPGVSLEDLYVETGAHLGDDAASKHELARALNDFLEGAHVDGVMRDELLRSIRSRLQDGSASEHTSARVHYQQHGSLVVLGDPGSGKTWFVKRELLAYCSAKPESWYGKHVPLYVSLAELAAQIDADVPIDILDIARTLLARRGIELTLADVKEQFSRGLLALFFDGLDEIVSFERRAAVFAALKLLIENGRPHGNRFVLTSRPAAINRGEVPRGVTAIQMRGLTDAEMRLLAERILAARLSESLGTIRVDVGSLTQTERTVLEQLLDDCRTQPGIDRLARNPLFLTLLVMIYANSGPPSAKRHRVYQQAVNTLVAIRARDAGQRGLSEADLRRRLGAVALSVFRDPQGALPSADAVIRQIQGIMSDERSQPVGRAETEQYLQDVAEATGLIVFHRSLPPDQPGSLTFMHHSFLEYYAALGLSATDYREQLHSLARIPRWRDVLTLLAGILGDTGDIYPMVETLLAIPDPIDSITLDSTLLALDCALESEIPPERVLRALLRRLEDSIASGPLLYDADLREEVGERLERLMSGSESQLIDKFFVDGFGSEDIATCAAYIDILGHVAVAIRPHDNVLAAYDRVTARQESTVRAAVCSAISRAESLRSPAAIAAVMQALESSKATQVAAANAIAAAPGIGKASIDRLAESMSSGSDEVAEASARAILKVGVPLDSIDNRRTELLTDSLKRVAEGASRDVVRDLAVSFARADVEPFLLSDDRHRRVLGIRLLAWIDKDEEFVRDYLMQFVNSDDREERAAALGSLRINQRAQKLVTTPHANSVKKMLGGDQPRDVRLAAARLLGVIGWNDAPTSEVLIEFAKDSRKTDLYEQAVNILSWIAEAHETVKAFLVDEAESVVMATRKSRSGDGHRDTTAILRALEGVDTAGTVRLVQKLSAIVSDYKYSIEIRKQALYTFAWVCDIETGARSFSSWIKTPPSGLFAAVAVGGAQFIERCRKRLEYIRTVHQYLEGLQELLANYYSRAIAAIGGDGESFVPAIRGALGDIRDMLNSYREFSQRRSASPQLTLEAIPKGSAVAQ